MDRRDFLFAASALSMIGLAPGAARALGAATPFSFDALTEQARSAAARPWEQPTVSRPDLFEAISYDVHWRIRWRDESTLYPAGMEAPVQLFHPGRYFPLPVRIHLVDGDVAREVEFDRSLFDMPADSAARELPLDDLGFAGFRVMRPGLKPDWVSFLGASYFRTDGPFKQYGLSARGLAVDTGLSQPEEFPRFNAFWIGAGEDGPGSVTVHAMMESPSLAGAYRMALVPGEEGEQHVTRVDARIFMREGVERIGFAPLTSMYWYGERNRIMANDWRPEVHDSDGLAIVTGSGERIWRPLNNPDVVRTSSFSDVNPRGFGLIQRDRDFSNYEDDGVFYDRRPSAWVRTIGDWGAGAVQLVEIPTEGETFDNIVAYWTPAAQPKKGEALEFAYEIDWCDVDPMAGDQARVVAARQGRGGAPGQEDVTPAGLAKIVVDFAGEALSGATPFGQGDDPLEPVIEAAGAEVLGQIGLRPVVGEDAWRLSFDVKLTGAPPAELRIHIRRGGEAVSETLLMQHGGDMRGRG